MKTALPYRASIWLACACIAGCDSAITPSSPHDPAAPDTVSLGPPGVTVTADVTPFLGDSSAVTAVVRNGGGFPMEGVEVRWTVQPVLIGGMGMEIPFRYAVDLIPPSRTDARGRTTGTLVLPLLATHRLVAVATLEGVTQRDTARLHPRLPSLPSELIVTPLPEMPASRYGTAAAAQDGRVVVIGGTCGNYVTSALSCGNTAFNVLIFDTKQGTWRVGPALPGGFQTPVEGWLGASLAGDVHALRDRDHFRFDPLTERWSVSRPPPVSAAGGMVASAASKLIMITANGDVQRYSPESDAWVSGASWPRPRPGAAVAVLNDEVFVMGGGGGTADDHMIPEGLVDRYDPMADRWITAPPMPLGRRDFAAAAIGGSVCAAGGGFFTYRGVRSLSETYCYRPGDRAWRLAGLTAGAIGTTAVALDGGMLLVGGAHSLGTSVPYLLANDSTWLVERR